MDDANKGKKDIAGKFNLLNLRQTSNDENYEKDFKRYVIDSKMCNGLACSRMQRKDRNTKINTQLSQPLLGYPSNSQLLNDVALPQLLRDLTIPFLHNSLTSLELYIDMSFQTSPQNPEDLPHPQPPEYLPLPPPSEYLPLPPPSPQ